MTNTKRISHTNCTHAATSTARTACRKAQTVTPTQPVIVRRSIQQEWLIRQQTPGVRLSR